MAKEQIKISQSTVFYILQKYNRFETIGRQSGAGQKCKTTQRDDQQLVRGMNCIRK